MGDCGLKVSAVSELMLTGETSRGGLYPSVPRLGEGGEEEDRVLRAAFCSSILKAVCFMKDAEVLELSQISLLKFVLTIAGGEGDTMETSKDEEEALVTW